MLDAPDEVCAVCLDITDTPKIRKWDCRHTFHEECIMHWNISCPLCRTKDMHELSSRDYRPCGTTSLFDALGDTINWYRYERDVLMVVITDGQENSSTKYKKNEVLELIKEKETHRGWSYVYLGCDLQVASQGDSLGFRSSATASNCRVDQRNYGQFVSQQLSKAISKHRTKGISVQEQLNSQF